MIRDSELVLGVKVVLEDAGKSVYTDWIESCARPRTSVGLDWRYAAIAMRACDSLLYLCSPAWQRLRWMLWKLGYVDCFNGSVASLPVLPEGGALDFDREEYLQLYPKVDVVDVTGNPSLHVNGLRRPVQAEHKSFDRRRSESEKLRSQF